MEGLRLSSTYKCTSAAKLAVRPSNALLTTYLHLPIFTRIHVKHPLSPTAKEYHDKREVEASVE